ncbi:MAG: hypothetical protein ABI778_11460 [Ignavibacteriota bacterium]
MGFFSYSQLRAQSLLVESPRSASLSSSATGFNSPELLSANPANESADSLRPLRATLVYSPFVGGIADASIGAVEAVYYSDEVASSFGLGAANLSYGDLYSDLSLSGSITRRFSLSDGRTASAGIRTRYETISSTTEYPALHFLFFDLGFTLSLTREFDLGGAALNILGEKYILSGGQSEPLERSFIVAVAYHPENFPLKVFTSLHEIISAGLTISFGAEYEPVEFLALRLGTSTDTGNITTGIGLRYASLSFDVSSRYERALGSVFSFGASGAW